VKPRSVPIVRWLVAGLLAGCASTGSTFDSGVGDRLLEAPPYYAGRLVGAGSLRVAHLPVAYQRGGSQPSFLDPRDSPGSAIAVLLEEMNAHLASLGASVPLGVPAPLPGTPPDVRFGCDPRPIDECDPRSFATGMREKTRMRLAVGRPSSSWVEALGGALDAAGADAALVLTLEVDQYWAHQRDLRGRKEVRLGTDHVVDLPWLTSLDQPVQVLQLTGALVGSDGRAIRIGAEGLVARRTRLLLSAFDVQELIRDEDVARLREPFPGDRAAPSGAQRPVWQAALEAMVAELTGASALSTR
jgi:hypothetical protein